MKIAFFTALPKKSKTGLFNATHDRIKQFKINKIDFEIFNLWIKDDFTLKFIRKISFFFPNKKYTEEVKLDFNHDSINYKNYYLKRNFISVVLYKLSIKKHPYSKDSILHLSEKIKDYTLISSHWGGLPADIAYIVNTKTKKPYYVTYHGSDINVFPFIDLKLKQKTLKILENATKNIFVSNALLNKALELGHSAGNNIVIYNGLSSNFQNKDRLNQNKIRNNEPKKVAFIGNLVDVKNVNLLPQIFHKIKKKKEAEFYVIGDGILYNSIKNDFFEYNLDVIFTGKITRKEVFKYLNEIDLLILPSKNEGLPLILLEAISYGVTCIGSNVGGIAEVIGNENTVDLNQDFIENISKLAIQKLTSDNNPPKLNDNFLIENSFKKELNLYNEQITHPITT